MGAPETGSPSASRGTLPHKYVGGHPAVDLVNTVDWTARGLVDERLESYARLTAWAEGAGVVAPALGTALRERAEGASADAARALATAHELRAVLQRTFTDVVAGRPLDGALAALAPFVADAAARRRLTAADPADPRAAGAAACWTWDGVGPALAAPLWPVAWAAAELLASPEAARLRVCGAADCGWMYVDRSRNGFRRWCQMEVCGTREKSRRRAGRASPRP